MSLASWCVGGTWQAYSTDQASEKSHPQSTDTSVPGRHFYKERGCYSLLDSLLPFSPPLPFCPLTQPQPTHAPGLSQSGPLLTSIPPTPALPLLSASCPLRGQESDIWSPAPGPVVGEVVFFSAWRVGCEKKAQEGKKEESLSLAVSLSS